MIELVDRLKDIRKKCEKIEYMMAEMSLQAACAIDDYYNLRDSIRKEIEGKFIDGAIKSAELAGGNKPFEVGRCKRRGKEYRVSIIVTPVDKNEMPKIACPKCGAQYDDYDGLSFSYCPACGYCSHPNSTVENGKEICGICGREIKKEV